MKEVDDELMNNHNKEISVSLDQFQVLLESLEGVLYVTEIHENGEVDIVYASGSLFSSMNRKPEEVGKYGENALSVVLPEDLSPLLNKVKVAAFQNEILDHTYRVKYPDGKIEWRNIHGVNLPDEGDGVKRMIHLLTNVDDHEQTDETLQEKNRIVDFALRNTDINIWYFNGDTHECLQGENCQATHEMPGDELMKNFPECLVDMGYVREDSIEAMRHAYQRLWETGENEEFDAWFRKADGTGWWCERDMLIAIKGPDGRVIRGVGIGKNVTAEKELEEKYLSFQSHRQSAEMNTLLSLRINLTSDAIEECSSEARHGDIEFEGKTIDEFFHILLKYTANGDEKEKCHKFFSRKYMIKEFSLGNSKDTIEYRCIGEKGESIWLRATVEMMNNPINGDTEALIFIYDINYEKNMLYVIDRLLDADYEFLGLIDVASKDLMVYGKNKDMDGVARSGKPYESEMKQVFHDMIAKEYLEEGIRTMSLDHVIKELSKQQYYTCSFPAKAIANTIAGQKQWKFGYLDESKSQILLARTDITDVYTAEYDSLTGLYNRQAFYRHAQVMLETYPDETFILIRCDVDRFKAYNDVYGTQEADRLLAAFGRTIRANKWSSKTFFGRIEGDHFGTMLPIDEFDMGKYENVQKEWLRNAQPGYHLSVSVGIYEITDRTIPISLMCDRALLALRTVKDNYANKVAYYDEQLREKLMEEQMLIDDMEIALKEGQFVLYYQPQISYRDGSLIGTEALVRWLHPKQGLIPPIKFIPLFENNGFILKLDAYVWEKSCAYLKKKLEKGGPLSNIPISVNVSRRDLYDQTLCEKLCKLLEKYEVPISLLHLEITESAYMEDPNQLHEVVSQLRKVGFVVEMDDFGTGYSSLNMLKDISVDNLKLDMRFLSELESDERGKTILATIVKLAKNLNLPIIAEGVETKAQADYLKSLGCFDMQGYYFSRPIMETEYEHRFHSGIWKQEVCEVNEKN